MTFKEYSQRKEAAAAEQGWDERSRLLLAERFIESRKERRARFVRFLEKTAREENQG